MNFLRKHFSKTFIKIAEYITIAMLMLITIFSVVQYRYFENIGLKIIESLNKQTVSQLSHNISYMNEMIKNFCITQFLNTDIRQLMFSKENDPFELQRLINRFAENTLSFSSIHSVIVYNGYTNQYYSTFSGITQNDAELNNIIKVQSGFPALTPIPRTLSKKGYYKDIEVFTYYMSDSSDKNNSVKGSLIVNAKIDWLTENLKKIKGPNLNLIIVTRDGKVLADSTGKLKMFDSITHDYTEKLSGFKYNEGSFISEKSIIIYSAIPNTDWYLLTEASYTSVFKEIDRMKYQTIALTLVFGLLSLLLSFFISQRVYNPLKKLVHLVKNKYFEETSDDHFRDDVSYISNAFNHSEDTLEKFKKTTSDILKDNILKSMLLENSITVNKFLEQNFEKSFDILTNNSSYLLILLKIDRYYILNEMDKNDKGLIKLVISNIVNEVLDGYSCKEVVDTGNDEVVIILEIPAPDNNYLGGIKQKIASIQFNVNRSSNITVSAVISDILHDISKLSGTYKELVHLMKYKMFYGSGCILVKGEIINKNTKHSFIYPVEIEKKLISELKYGNEESIQKIYNSLMEAIPKDNYDNFMVSVMHLCQSLKTLISEINGFFIDDIKLDFDSFYIELINLDTLDEINHKFLSLFSSLTGHKKALKENKHNILLNSVKDYINTGCCHQNLNLKEIAAEFRLTPGYLGKLFKDTFDKSVSEYINEARLQKASYFLKFSDNSIKEIMDKTGFDSESNFYRLFKLCYGVTPSDYRLKEALKNKIVE